MPWDEIETWEEIKHYALVQYVCDRKRIHESNTDAQHNLHRHHVPSPSSPMCMMDEIDTYDEHLHQDINHLSQNAVYERSVKDYPCNRLSGAATRALSPSPCHHNSSSNAATMMNMGEKEKKPPSGWTGWLLGKLGNVATNSSHNNNQQHSNGTILTKTTPRKEKVHPSATGQVSPSCPKDGSINHRLQQQQQQQQKQQWPSVRAALAQHVPL